MNDRHTMDLWGLPIPPKKTGKILRDEGVQTVLTNAGELWREQAVSMLMEFCLSHAEFIGEDFKLWALSRGLPKPHHHNSFGGIFSRASRFGFCQITDRSRHTNEAQSHARRSALWVSLIYERQG